MFARGKFGIEYNTAPRRDEPGPVVPVVIALVFVVALASFCWTIYGRLKGDDGDRIEAVQVEAAKAEDQREEKKAEETRAKKAEESVPLKGLAEVVAPTPAPRVPEAVREPPVQVRNLLIRLKEAERKRDVEMAITTIEQLRALPGKPAADLDDNLARKLGELNLQRLFTMRTPLWTVEVKVGRGDSAIRLAYEHGSTFASMERLNPNADLNRVRVGQKLRVMNHPTFRLLVYRSSRTADLLLNGKFFKRYYLSGAVKGQVGGYELSKTPGQFWTSLGISLTRADRAELEMLMPRGSSVILSEF